MIIPEEIQQTYIIERAIGEGGAGIVYLATHTRLRKKVVLKKIKGIGSDFVNYRAEVDILKNLRHSYLPQVIDFIESPDGIFTVMDYIDGESLKQMMDRGYRFGEKEVRKYAEQLCEAVRYLHSQNPPIIHGDIKPDNVMVTREGNICLIDFNISGFLSGKGIQTYGFTPGFSSPEQMRAFQTAATKVKEYQDTIVDDDEPVYTPWEGDEEPQEPVFTDATTPLSELQKQLAEESEVDVRSDIYSIGATVYVLLGGKTKDIEQKALVFPEKVSDGMRILVAKALDQNPNRRYQTALEMLNAVKQVQKMDGSYRSLLFKQRLKTFIYFVILVSSVVLIVLGSRKMTKEKEEKYDGYIEQLKDARKSELSIEEVDELYNNALKIHEDRLEPYYYKTEYVYYSDDRKPMASLIKKVENLSPGGDPQLYSKLWYLMADTLFEEEDYSHAKEYYAESIELDPENVSLYRDYAISLVYVGTLQKAESVLETAIDKGMREPDIYMVKGELARYKGNNDLWDAIDCFEKVIRKTEDEHQKLRAGVALSKCCLEEGSEDSLRICIRNLDNISKELSMTNNLLIYEELGAAYIKLGDLKKDKDQYLNAIEVYEKIVEMAWANDITYSNLVVLNQRAGKNKEAEEWAIRMCEKYPDNYDSFKRRALVEAEKQGNLEIDKRDYKDFVEYYNKAEELYKGKKSQDDGEMEYLRDVYKKLVENDWIK